MFVLCHALLKTDYRYSSEVFFHIKSADSKGQLLDRLCRTHFAKEIIETEWKPLYKEIKAAIIARNSIAHYEANYIIDFSILDPNEPAIALTPHHLDAKAQDNPNKQAIRTKDLTVMGERFLQLSLLILRFVSAHFQLRRLRATRLPPRLLQYLANSRNDQPKP